MPTLPESSMKWAEVWLIRKAWCDGIAKFGGTRLPIFLLRPGYGRAGAGCPTKTNPLMPGCIITIEVDGVIAPRHDDGENLTDSREAERRLGDGCSEGCIPRGRPCASESVVID